MGGNISIYNFGVVIILIYIAGYWLSQESDENSKNALYIGKNILTIMKIKKK